MIAFLRKYPLYLILLPLFFVLHGWKENYGLVTSADLLPLLFEYILLSAGIWVVSFILSRNWPKAAAISLCWLLFYFFFAAIHDFVQSHRSIRWMAHYRLMLPAFFLMLLGIYFWLRKTKMSHAKFNLFANSLFVVYIIFDGAVLSGEAFHLSGRNTSTREYLQETERDICDTCAKPDIFFLVFDEYESSNSLKKRFGYRNNLDSILLMKNFHIQWHSRSNYNLTPFSMASTLNMDYLEQIPDPQAITAGDYANCIPLMKHCRVLHILQTQGYKVFNRSIFNLWDQPAFMRQKFIPMGSAVIRSRTLISKLKRDIGWAFIDKWPYLRKPGDQFELDSENLKLVDSVMNLSHPSAMQPRFIYAHFMMPHKPFFRDQYGRKKDLAEIDEELHSIPASAYLNYLPFVNGQITKMVDAIMNNDPKAVIILLSDHGFRSEKYTGFPDFYFNNLSAIYYPDGKYGGVPDSLSNVNLFRVVFNKLFQQSYELLKDRPVFLQDAKVLNSWN